MRIPQQRKLLPYTSATIFNKTLNNIYFQLSIPSILLFTIALL